MLPLLLSTAWATWSVVAVDPDTREVGIAGATCSPMVWYIGGLSPDHGAVAAQYATSLPRKADVVAALETGATPAEALDVGRDGDRKDALRQWAVVGLNGPPATFTGGDVEDATVVSGDTWSVSGNTLADPSVVEDAAAALDEGLPLADRLLAALEAGAAAGGDARCPADVAAKSAFLFVAGPDDEVSAPTVEVRASGAGAVVELRERYEAGGSGCAHGGGFGVAGLLGPLLMRRRVRGSGENEQPSFAPSRQDVVGAA